VFGIARNFRGKGIVLIGKLRISLWKELRNLGILIINWKFKGTDLKRRIDQYWVKIRKLKELIEYLANRAR